MRLYTTTGATQVDDPEFGTFTPDANGAFEFPEPLGAKLHGRPGWETEDVRTARIASEELDRLRDPATLLAELRKMGEGQGALTQLMAHALGMAPAAGSSTTAPSEAPTEAGGDATVEKSSAETTKSTTTRVRAGRTAKSATSDAS